MSVSKKIILKNKEVIQSWSVVAFDILFLECLYLQDIRTYIYICRFYSHRAKPIPYDTHIKIYIYKQYRYAES